MGIFEGKVIGITGASGGIGGAAAEFFLKESASLLLISRSAPRIPPGERVIVAQGDIKDRHFVENTIANALGAFGHIDVLINAAATLGAIGPLASCDPAEWEEAVRVNLFGTFYAMHAILPHMKERNAGKIINFAGGGAAYSLPRFSAYGSSKTAVVRLTEIAADELAEYNIQVNVIAPGAVETKMLQKVREGGGEVRTVVAMEEPVRLLSFLASSASDHITGRFIHSRDRYEEFSPSMDKELYKLRRKQ